jgi:hypothetical protein
MKIINRTRYMELLGKRKRVRRTKHTFWLMDS